MKAFAFLLVIFAVLSGQAQSKPDTAVVLTQDETNAIALEQTKLDLIAARLRSLTDACSIALKINVGEEAQKMVQQQQQQQEKINVAIDRARRAHQLPESATLSTDAGDGPYSFKVPPAAPVVAKK